MATKYWVGGSGTWDGTTNTNWSNASGGTGGTVQAPCSLDDVVFDSLSNATAYTVTIATGAVCKSINVAGPLVGNVTVAGSGALYVYGDFTLPATGLTRTYTGAITFASNGSQTITTNGQSLASALTFGTTFASGLIGAWTLGGALTTSSSVTLTNGSLNTANYAVSCAGILDSAVSTGFTLSLGSSSVVSSGSFVNSSPLFILNAGTSSISSSYASGGITAASGLTFYDFAFTSTAKSSTAISGNNTFHNLTFATPATASCYPITIGGNQTITGTLTLTGSSSVNRYFVQSDTIGTARTITAAAIAAMSDVDFMDITGAGTATWSGTRLGNCAGNSGITFVAGANRYIAAGTATSTWQSNIWTNSSGGAASTAYFPLAQDTIIIDNAGLNTSATLTKSIAYNEGAFDSSTRSNAMSLTYSAGVTYGSFNISSSLTTTPTLTIGSRSTATLTTSSKTLSSLTMRGLGGTLSLSDAISGSGTITCTAGTIDFNGKNVTSSGSIIFSNNSYIKEIKLGSGTISVNNGVYCNGAYSNATLTTNTATLSVSSSTPSLGILGGVATFYNVTFSNAAAYSLTFYGDITFNNLTLTSPTTLGENLLTLYGNMTVAGTLALAGGASVTQRLFINSIIPGTQRTITAATVTGLSDIDFRDIKGAGTATWTGGTRIGDCKGNSGIGFTAASTKYWNLAGTQNWSATGWATSSGGAPAVNNFPLAQDTCIFDDAGSAGTVTIDAAWNIGTITASSRTAAMTFTSTGSPFIYGDITYGSGLTLSGTGSFSFYGTGTQTFTTAGKTITNSISIFNPSCNFNHGDAYLSTSGISVTFGTYNTQNYSISCSSFAGPGANIRTINFGSSTLTFSSILNFLSATTLTFNAGTSTINFSGSTAQTLNLGSQTYNNISFTGAGAKTILGSNTFNTLSNSVQPITVNWTAGTTQTFTNFNLSGTAGNLITNLSTIPGAQYTLKKSGTWNVGANSVDYGNNTGLTFSGSSQNYLSFKDAFGSNLSSYLGNFFAFF